MSEGIGAETSTRRLDMKRLLRVTWLLYAVLCLPVVGGAQAARMDLEAFGRIVRLADPQLSPDGKSIAVVVSRANFDENRYDAELTIVDVTTGARRVLTKELRGISSPRWSPNCKGRAPPICGLKPEAWRSPAH